MSWCTIESDPGVFTELTEAFGVNGCEVTEFLSLDEAASFDYGPILGLIYLFKVDGSVSHPPRDEVPLEDNVFFIRQTIQNACATVALLNTLTNVPSDGGVKLGPLLSDFKSTTTDIDPESRGDVLETLEDVRKAHNSFTQEAYLTVEDKKRSSKADPFHFVAFIQNPSKPDQAVELDGLRPTAVAVPSDIPSDTPVLPTTPEWLKKAVAEVQRRMEAFAASGELRFSLMALHPARLPILEARLAAATDAGEQAALRAEIETVTAQRKEWKEENARRRHNLLPFVVTLLKVSGVCYCRLSVSLPSAPSVPPPTPGARQARQAVGPLRRRAHADKAHHERRLRWGTPGGSAISMRLYQCVHVLDVIILWDHGVAADDGGGLVSGTATLH